MSDGERPDWLVTRDADGLAEYLQTHRDRLLGLIVNRLGAGLRRKLEPEDILQQVSVEAFRALPAVDFAGRDPFGWLCQLIERRIVDAHRYHFAAQKRAAGREVPLDSPVGGERAEGGGLLQLLVASFTTPSQAFSRNARQARLQEALDQLPELQREALRLRYVDGLASKEIAERLAKSDAAVRVMLSRSVKQLQLLLGEETA